MKKSNKLLNICLAFLGVFVMLFSFFNFSFIKNDEKSSAITIIDISPTRYTLSPTTRYNTQPLFVDVYGLSSIYDSSSTSTFTYFFDNNFNDVNYTNYLISLYNTSLKEIYTSLYVCFIPINYTSHNYDYSVINAFDVIDRNGNVVKSYLNVDSTLTNVNLFDSHFINFNYILEDLQLSIVDFYQTYGFRIQTNSSHRIASLSLDLININTLKDIAYSILGDYDTSIFDFVYNSVLSGIAEYYYINAYSFDYNLNTYYQDVYRNGYNIGYSTGYNDGLGGDSLIKTSVFTFASYPFTLLAGFLNFNIFGVNIYYLLLSIISLFLVIWVVCKII